MTVPLIIARELCMMMLLIATGVIIRRFNICTEATGRQISDLAVSVVTPVLIINTFQRDKIPEVMAGFWQMLGFSIAIFALYIIIVSRVFRCGDNYKSMRICAVIPNCLYMGVPLLMAATGESSVLFCGGIFAAFQLLMWCWAIPMLEGGRPGAKRILLNPGAVAVAAGLTLFALDVRLPAMLRSFMGQLSALNTPLSLLVLGIFLARIKPAELIKPGPAYLVTLMRNVLLPVLAVAIMKALRMDTAYGKAFAQAFVIMLACPSAIGAMMLSVRGGEDGAFASRTVALSALFSLATLPLIMYLTEIVFA